MLGERRAWGDVSAAGRKEKTVGARGGIYLVGLRSVTVNCGNVEPPRVFTEPPRTATFTVESP
jgi:hypothetical protein